MPSKYERTPMSVMRRKIAEHMVMSRRTSPHVHSAFEIDFTKVDEIRKAKKAEYEKAGGKLTYMSFITKACAEASRKCPSSTRRWMAPTSFTRRTSTSASPWRSTGGSSCRS